MAEVAALDPVQGAGPAREVALHDAARVDEEAVGGVGRTEEPDHPRAGGAREVEQPAVGGDRDAHRGERVERRVEAALRDRPGDLRRAWQAAAKQPVKFMQQLRAGSARLSKQTRAALETGVGAKRARKRTRDT